MLFRDDAQMALNDVETRCLEALDRHASAASRLEGDPLATLFDDLKKERQHDVAALAPHIRALGDLPKALDPDKEDMEELLQSILPFFTGDERDSLLEHSEQAEAALAEAITAALACQLPAETLDLLKQMLESSRAAREKLAECRTA